MTDSALIQLQNELSKIPAQRNEAILIELLGRLEQSASAEAVPVLDAVSRHYPSDDVRQAANQAMSVYSTTFQSMWDRTVVDQVSTATQRAARLSALDELDLTPLEMIQAMFNEVKGEPIQVDDDPRLPLLKRWVSSSNSRISSAAAFALCRAYKR